MISPLARKLKLEGKISDRLYNDAKNRLSRPLSPKNAFIQFDNKKPVKNIWSDTKLATVKFDNKFSTLFKEIDKGKKSRLNKVELGMICEKLECVKKYDQGNDKDLINSLWEVLQGEKWNGISEINLFIALKAILQLGVENIDFSKFNEPREGILKLTDLQKQQFKKLFYPFYLKFRYQKELDRSPKHQENEFLYKPTLSPKTQKIAQKLKGIFLMFLIKK